MNEDKSREIQNTIREIKERFKGILKEDDEFDIFVDEDEYAERKHLKSLIKELFKMDDAKQNIFIAYMYGGLFKNMNEMARAMNISRQTLSYQIRKIKSDLKKGLQK